MPLLHPPFSPCSTPIVYEEVKGTASVMEPEKPEVPKKYCQQAFEEEKG